MATDIKQLNKELVFNHRIREQEERGESNIQPEEKESNVIWIILIIVSFMLGFFMGGLYFAF